MSNPGGGGGVRDQYLGMGEPLRVGNPDPDNRTKNS